MAVDLTTVRIEWNYPDNDQFITDPRFEGGGAGWFMPTGGKKYKRLENPIPSLEYNIGVTSSAAFEQALQPTQPGPYAVFDTTGTDGTVYSRFWDATPGDASYNNTGMSISIGRTSTSPNPIKVFVDAYNDANTLLGSTQDDSLVYATAVGWTTINRFFTSGLPSGTTKLRARIVGIGVYAVRNCVVQDQEFEEYYWGGASGIPSARINWFQLGLTETNGARTTLTELATAISIKRGSRPNPPVDQLEIGTMTIRFKRTPTGLRPGYRVRVQTKDAAGEWKPIYQGRLSDIIVVDPLGSEPGYTEWRVEDRVADLARDDSTAGIKGGHLNVQHQFESVSNGTPTANGVYPGPAIRVNQASGAPFMGTETIVTTDNSNMLDYTLTIRNTDMGLLWCDVNNQLQYVPGRGGSYLTSSTVDPIPVPDVPNRATRVFVKSNKAAGQFTPSLGGYDREVGNAYAINSLEWERLTVYRPNTSTPYTYPKVTQVRENRSRLYKEGRKFGKLTTIDLNGYGTFNIEAGSARAYMYKNNVALTTAVDQWKWDVSSDPTPMADFDIYDNVTLPNVNNTVITYRVIGIEHDITPGRWVVKLIVRPKERIWQDGSPTPTSDYVSNY